MSASACRFETLVPANELHVLNTSRGKQQEEVGAAMRFVAGMAPICAVENWQPHGFRSDAPVEGDRFETNDRGRSLNAAPIPVRCSGGA